MTGQPGPRRVLVVTSSYAPATIADMHRARHLAWELPKLGWETELLCPGIAFQPAEFLDPDAIPLFNPEATCHEVTPRGEWVFRLLKMRTIGYRAFLPLQRAGEELLRRKKFDLIYFTTANFPLFCLGRRWASAFNVPYVLDYHDPWVRDHEHDPTAKTTLKQKLSKLLFRFMERYAIDGASGVVSVSPVYLDELRVRYGALPSLQTGRCEVIPFAAREQDLSVRAEPVKSDTVREIVYVGAGGSIMARSFATICAAMAEVRKREPELVARLRVKLVGTYAYWKEGDPKPLQEIAARFGLSDIIQEDPARISYAKAIALAAASDGLLVLGVDDAGYVPSKLFTYALTGKPLLACLRTDSPATRLFEQLPGLGHLMTFDQVNGSTPESCAAIRAFLGQVNCGHRCDRRGLVADYLAPAMARKHARMFQRICQEHAGA